MSAGSLPDEAQLLQKLKQQNALLKKAVLQEQRRRTAADEALEKSKGEGLTLTAHIEELSALLTSLSTSQLHVDTAPPDSGCSALAGISRQNDVQVLLRSRVRCNQQGCRVDRCRLHRVERKGSRRLNHRQKWRTAAKWMVKG